MGQKHFGLSHCYGIESANYSCAKRVEVPKLVRGSVIAEQWRSAIADRRRVICPGHCEVAFGLVNLQ
jgi:hypothetical protein